MIYFMGGIVAYLAVAFIIACFREDQLDLGKLGIHLMFAMLNGFLQIIIWS